METKKAAQVEAQIEQLVAELEANYPALYRNLEETKVFPPDGLRDVATAELEAFLTHLRNELAGFKNASRRD